MNTDELKEQVKTAAKGFEKISLQEMDGVKLMERMDVKYLIPAHLLINILEDSKDHYKVLEIDQEHIAAYETMYYDTENLDLYHNHQRGKANRYKIRFRNYVDSNLSFFEIKFKNNKGRTLKTRIEQPNIFEPKLNSDVATFLEETTPISADKLTGKLKVTYDRITLVNKNANERLTFDVALKFLKGEKEKSFNKIVVLEVKQDKLWASPIIEILKKYRLRSGSISKYCLGVMSTETQIKANRFKPKLLHLKKIINQYDTFARASSSN